MTQFIDFDRFARLTEGIHPDGTDHWDLDGPSIEVETGVFLYGLMRRLQPHVAIETGTNKGYSSAWIALGMADNAAHYEKHKGAKLHTVDMTDYGQEELWNHIGISDFIQKYVHDSLTVQMDIEEGTADFVFLDADHSAEAIIEEWKNFLPLMADNVVVAFHDTDLDKRMDSGIRHIMTHLIPVGSKASLFKMRNMRGFDMIHMEKTQ